MIISNSLLNSINTINNQINKVSKKINNSGYENTTENLFYKLRNSNVQATKDIEIKGIDAASEKYNHYDNILNQATVELDKFKNLSINKINDGLNESGVEALNKDMDSVISVIESLINTKIGNTKLFDIKTEMLIGNRMRVPRTFDRDFIQLDGIEITDILKEIRESDTPDLDKIQEVFNLVEKRHVEIGARWSGLKSTKSIYENVKLTENEFMAKRYDLEGSIAELNDLSLSYEALMKTIAKISSLSLVNYI